MIHLIITEKCEMGEAKTKVTSQSYSPCMQTRKRVSIVLHELPLICIIRHLFQNYRRSGNLDSMVTLKLPKITLFRFYGSS